MSLPKSADESWEHRAAEISKPRFYPQIGESGNVNMKLRIDRRLAYCKAKNFSELSPACGAGAAARPPSRTGRKIRYHSSTIRDHIEAPTRGSKHVITNSKNRFH